jgi:hypothetical protein
MKKIVITVLILLIVTLGFSIRLGVQLQNFNGYYNGMYLNGVRVTATAPGYPAYGYLQPGDIITEAIMLPNSQIWGNPGMPNGGALISFNPYYPLNQQLMQLAQYNYQYNYTQTTSYTAMVNFINSAPYYSNIIMRIYRPSWNSWTLASVVLDSNGQGSVWMMPMPQQQPQVQVNPTQPQVQVNPNNPTVQIDPNFQIRIWLHF